MARELDFVAHSVLDLRAHLLLRQRDRKIPRKREARHGLAVAQPFAQPAVVDCAGALPLGKGCVFVLVAEAAVLLEATCSLGVVDELEARVRLRFGDRLRLRVLLVRRPVARAPVPRVGALAREALVRDERVDEGHARDARK
jgi:hypothetical protein